MRRLFSFLGLLAATTAWIAAADTVTVDPNGTVTIAGGTPPGGVTTSGEARIAGGGAAFAQRIMAGIAGGAGPSIFFGSQPGSIAPNSVEIGGGHVVAANMKVTRVGNALPDEVVHGNDTRLSDSRPANGGNAATVGGIAPGNIALLDGGKLLPSQLPAGIFDAPVIPANAIVASGSTLGTGGIFSFATCSIVTAQSISVPTRIYCSGDVTVSAAINATAPLEIEAAGTVTVNSPITTPFLSIRSGSLTLNASLSAHGAKTMSQWTFDRLQVSSRPDPAYNDPAHDSRTWRAIVIETAGGISTSPSGTMQADDVFVYSGGSLNIYGNITAYWLLTNVDGSSSNAFTWTDGARSYLHNNYGGVGGTGGGWGRYGSAAGSSIWRGAARPYLQHTYDLARGSVGRTWRSAQRGWPGGRISIYAHGDLTANSAVISANSTNSNGSGSMVGGAGTVRAVAGGELSGGSWTANGGTGNGSQEHGGGGGVYLLAASISGGATVSATAVSQATAGTTATETTSSAAIRDLAARGLFAAFPPKVPIR